jgi:hypothetical protein
MCCIVGEIVGGKDQCACLLMPVFVRRLPNPRTTKLRDNLHVLSKEEEVGQHQQSMLALGSGINLLMHKYQHHHLLVTLSNSSNILWVG